MLRVLLFLILIISLSSSSLYADTNPFRFLNDSPRNKRYINFMCNKADLKKFRGATKIGYINLSIKDFNHESGMLKLWVLSLAMIALPNHMKTRKL